MKIAFVAVALAFISGSLVAQECDDDTTLEACFNRFVPAIPSPAQQIDTAETQAERVQDRVSSANTGLSSLVSPSASGLKDFLSVLSASLESDGDNQPLTLDWNIPAPITSHDDQIKLQLVIGDPKIGQDIADKLNGNTDAIAALDESLKRTDDLSASATYSPVNRTYGRSIAPHREMFEALVIAAIRASSPTRQQVLTTFRALLREHDITDPSKTFREVVPDDPVVRATLKAAVRDAFESQQVMHGAFTEVATRFAQLLNNQPQRFVSVVYRDRSDIVGHDEWTAKITWEFAGQNLNAFYDAYGACRSLSLTDLTLAAACLQQFNSFARNSRPTTRLALTGEYHSTANRSVALPQYGIGFESQGGKSLTYGAILSRTLAPDLTGNEGRIDLAVNYEDAGGDPNKQDRLIGSVTYTVKITDTLSIPVSLIYANHMQYLSNIDERLNAHFGIVYKLPRQ